MCEMDFRKAHSEVVLLPGVNVGKEEFIKS